MIYMTDNGRYLITDTDLSYAKNDQDVVQYNKIKTNHITSISEAPNRTMADCIQEALACPPNFDHEADLRIALEKAVPVAAMAHDECVAHLKTNPDRIPHGYQHVYETNSGRYALTRDFISASKLTDEGIKICETNLEDHDLANICFLTSYSIAYYLASALGGVFTAPEDVADHSFVYHDAVIRRKDGLYMIRDGKKYRTLTNVLQSEETDMVLKILLNKCLFQSWLCNLYLSITSV